MNLTSKFWCKKATSLYWGIIEENILITKNIIKNYITRIKREV